MFFVCHVCASNQRLDREEVAAVAANDTARHAAVVVKRKAHVPVAQRPSPELSMADPKALKALLADAGLKSPSYVCVRACACAFGEEG